MSQPPEPRQTEGQPDGEHASDAGAARPETPETVSPSGGPEGPDAPPSPASGEPPAATGEGASEASPAASEPAGVPPVTEGGSPEAEGSSEASPEASATGEGSSEASPEASATGEGSSEASPEAPAGEASPEASAEASVEASPAGEGAAKKKKRRRKRKKKPSTEAEGAGETRSAPVPFGAFFGGSEGRRHAFSVGEIVAGRVVRVAHGVTLVDLFGKATAIVDELEPHEVPPQPEPPPVVAAADPAQAGAVGVTPAPGAEAAPSTDDPPSDGAAVALEGTDTDAGVSAAPDPASEGVAEPEPPPGGTGEPDMGAQPPLDASPAEAEGTPSDASAAEAEGTPSDASAAEAEGTPSDASAAEAEGTPSDASAAEAEGTPSDEDAGEAAAEPQTPPPEPPSLGSIFRGRVGAVAESGHVAIVNRIIDREAAKAAIEQAREERRRVHGVVYGFNRGGFDVLVEGLRAFCPASGMALDSVDDPRPYVGRKLEFTLPPSKGGSSIIVSRRSILEREARKQARQRLKSIRPGHRMVGVVTDVRDFGAFVDLGEGLEGMVHVSELSWQRELKPTDVLKPGDEVVVRVLDVKPANRKERQGRVSLSIRAVEPDPWDEQGDRLTLGAPCRGRVVRTTDFGAFVELAPGIDGLLHISELGRELKHASQALSEGDEIDVVIDRLDPKQRRISLSKLSPMEAQMVESGDLDPKQRPRSLKPGSHITVLVERVDHGGVQVKVQGVLGRRGRGFIPNRELTGPEGGVDRKQLVPGHPLEVKVIGTDRDGGLRCSIKGRLLDEERKAVQSYRREASKQGLGTFGDLLRAKLGQDDNSTSE
jgi:small subunit ribosomal protein S1